MQWEQLSSRTIGRLSRDTVVVLPTAAVEQHGPHLPTGTDSLIGAALAERLDLACGGRLLSLPVQRIGCSEHHMAFPGTLTFQHETFSAAVLDMLNSIVRQDFRRVLLLNSHGGNQAINTVVAEKAACRWPEAQVVSTTWFRCAASRLADLVEGEFPSVGHACEFETSLMLALHPELVDMSAAVDDGLPPDAPQLRGDLLSGGTATLALPFHKVTKNGVYGKARLASAEKGRAILERTTAALRELIASCFPGALTVEQPR